MSDIASRISDILNSEEGMNQLRAIANSLGLAGNMPEVPTPPTTNGFSGGNPSVAPMPVSNNQANPLAALSSLFAPQASAPSQGSGFQIDPSMIFKLQSLLSAVNNNDNNTQLLLALRPHLSEERQKKVDDAIKIMQLVKIMPLIKEMGLFGGDKE